MHGSVSFFHLAGVVSDGTIPNIRRRAIESSFNPKVNGSIHIIQCFGAPHLDECCLFSSVSAFFGAPGQAAYAASNAFLDYLANHYWQRAQAVYSIQWGPWSEAGIAVENAVSRRGAHQGFGGLTNAVGVQIRATLFHIDVLVTVLVLQMACQFGDQSKSEGLKTPTGITTSFVKSEPKASVLCRDTIEAEIRDVLGSLIGDDPMQMHTEAPLMDVGLDSLSAVQFRNDLQKKIHIDLPGTLAFDYPSIRDIVEYIVS